MLVAAAVVLLTPPLHANKEGDRGFGRGVSGGGHRVSGSNRGGGRISHSTVNSRWSPTAEDKARIKKEQKFKREAAEWTFFTPFKLWALGFKTAEKAYKALNKQGQKTRIWQGKQTGYPSSRGIFGGGTSMFNRRNNK